MGPSSTLLENAGNLVGGGFIVGLAAAVAALLIVLQIFAALARRWQSSSGTPRALRAQARRHARRGEHERAADLFRAGGDDESAIEEYKAAGLPNRAAEVLFQRGRYAAAGALFERAEMWEPAADAHRRAGELKRAEACYIRAGKKLLVARMYEEAGETLKAAQYYRDIQKLDRAAELFEKLGKAGEAVELFEKLYFLAVAGLRERTAGITKAEVESLEAKVVSLRRAAGALEKLQAFYVRAGLFLKAGELAIEMGAADRAVDLFIRAGREDRAATILEKRGEALRAARIRGDLALRQGELRNAARHYEAAAEMRLAAEVYERLGDESRAAEMYEKAGDPGQSAFLYARLGRYERAAELYEESGDLDAALRCYETLHDEPRRAAILVRAGRHLRAGEAYFKMGRLEDAIACLQKVEPDEKDHPAALALLGLAFFEKGAARLALEKLDQAIAAGGASTPSVPAVEVYYARARCLEALGEAEAAATEYDRVLAIDFDFRDAAERAEALRRPAPAAGTHHEKAAARGGTTIAHAAATAAATPPPSREVTAAPSRPAGGATSGFSRPSPRAAMLSNLGEGRYKILEELGRGGMGVVYKCEDTLLGRIVAYKVLSSQIRDFPAALDNFLREAKSAARLNHPNIVTVYDFGESGDGYYMTLEYVPGRTLRQFMKSSPEPEKVRQVLAGICEGLAYAHSQNVVHRDIKPSNILVSDLDMKAKILDFGLAKVMEDVSQTASGVLGTPWYMSPEQVLGSQIDPRTDLYSLGVTLFEVFTGELPFRGRDFGYHHVHTPPPSPRSVSERVSEDLDRIILRCLQKKPDDRFQSAEAVRDAVLAARL